jgi:hypothetical protein
MNLARVTGVALTVAGLALGAAAAPADAIGVRITATAAPCRVKAKLSRPLRATAVLQERRTRGHWRTRARKRFKRRSVTLHCGAAAAGASVRRLRVLVRRRGRTIARSRVAVLRLPRLTPAPRAPGPGPGPGPGPLPEPPGPGPTEPLDPAQYGVEGTGGLPGLETFALLANPNVVLDADAVADLQAGRVDPRVVNVLDGLATDHVITVAILCTGASKFTSGGAVSLLYLGRGVDIAAVDGVVVSPTHAVARDLVGGLGLLGPAYRPDQVGTPWVINLPGYYTDAGTQNRLHIAFTQPIDPSWTPPPD